MLGQAGFEVARGTAGLDAAFVARSTGGRGRGLCVALLLGYDALPDLGHACGHNLFAAAGLGPRSRLHGVLDGIGGTVLAVGTPAEERGGGKVALTDADVFEGVDAALMFHPGVHDWSWAPLTAQTQARVGLHGRAAHPTGDPVGGIDALATLVQLFNVMAVSSRRLPPGSHVQGIVTDGGRATIIVPACAEGLFGLRAATGTELDVLVAAVGTWSGIHLTDAAGGVLLGSSDIGDVSNRVPAIHPFVAIPGEEESDRTPRSHGPRPRSGADR
ncbi:hypothetical protein EDE04_0065 [Streptomyces sp. 2132.2]|uniref:peptidase dimerization domain-containing protein n=1 Tax=Streptomyces sp. 2132.2 TaxID=2485161 RepID=UPI000F480119|nr:hypothetical protein EDE04_0065 [Streptomyces sp. 2132.2]